MSEHRESIRVWFHTSDQTFAEIITRALGPEYELQAAEKSLAESMEEMQRWDAVLLDLRDVSDEPTAQRASVLQEISRTPLPPPIIAIVAGDDHQTMRNLIQWGAFDTIQSPPDIVELRIVLRRARELRRIEWELNQLTAQHGDDRQLYDLLGISEPMQQVFMLARKIAACDVNVLITGETGTGKELLARAIHRLSQRASGPFVAFSCANLPETLVEDELFGHDKGAFTGALMMRRGRFEAADQGTLFLDEIGDLPLNLQAKLLRVLQERSFERLGSNTPIPVNVRVVSATHNHLGEMVKRGSFREDLYYRLNVVQIHLPALRERREEIPFLAAHFLERFAHQFQKKVRSFSRLAVHALEEYDWPGNVRELENVVQRAVVLADRQKIELWHMPAGLRKGFEPGVAVHSYEEEVRHFKRRLILRTLQECGWCKAETARSLGVARGYLHRLINQLQIHPTEPEEPVRAAMDQDPVTHRLM